MSLEAITWAYKTEVGSPSRKAVLLVLANYADADDASSFPSRSRIEAMTELKTTAVKDALRDLEEMGVISKEARLRPNGSNSSNRYTINLEWSADDPSPGSQTTPPRSPDDPPPNPKRDTEEGTPNNVPAARAEASGRRTKPERRLRVVADTGEELERPGSLPDDGPKPKEAPRPPTAQTLARGFQRAGREHYPDGDARRLANLTALRANMARWHKQDGIPLEEIALASDYFWANVDSFVRQGGEPWRRFINIFARMHGKATAPDTSDPAYYSDHDSEQENIEWTPEAWLAAQQ